MTRRDEEDYDHERQGRAATRSQICRSATRAEHEQDISRFGFDPSNAYSQRENYGT
jgi:hypothetical protein